MLRGKSKHLHYSQMHNLYLSTTVKPRELQEGDLKTCWQAKTSGQNATRLVGNVAKMEEGVLEWDKPRLAFLSASSYCNLVGGLILTLLPSGLLKGLKETAIKYLALNRDSIKDMLSINYNIISNSAAYGKSCLGQPDLCTNTPSASCLTFLSLGLSPFL